MKKIIFIVAIVVFVLSGCATRVPVSYQKPAKYDMKNYRNIEVEEVKVSPLYSFMGFNQRVIDLSEESGFTVYGDSQLFIDRSIANHLTNKIEKEIFKETYFSKADEREATGILETTITALELKQYIFGRKEKDDTTKYFLKQPLALAVNFKVKDGKDGKSVYSHNLRESYEKEYLLDPIEGYILFAPSVLPYFKDLADSIANQIASLIQPKRVTSSVALAANKPYLGEADKFYEAAKEKQWALAFSGFYSIFKDSAHIPSGYNAALIKEVLDERDEAIKIMKNVYLESGDKKALKQLTRMEKFKKEQDVATKQY